MTESLINSLSQLPHLSVKARSSVFRYKGKQVEPQQVASELAEHAVLNGLVVQRGDDLTLYLSLVDARNGNHHSRQSEIVELRFFGGLSSEETAAVLKVSPRTVMRDWAFARAWLRIEMSGAG